MTRLFCSYEEGFFADEAKGDNDDWLVPQVIAHHEAGHAVCSHALGFGCARIMMHHTYAGGKIFAGGTMSRTKKNRARIMGLLTRPAYRPELARFAISVAAGPAAERKCRLLNGLSQSVLGGSVDDHGMIDDMIGKRLETVGRNSFAFRRMVWRRAQVMLEHPNIWRAVETLAYHLDCLYPSLDDEIGLDHCSFDVLPGATARAIMRRCGVTPGMFGYLGDGAS